MNFENLEVGDRVIVFGRGMYNDSVQTVERFTKTHIILKNGNRYRRKDGYVVGGSDWERSYITLYSEERGRKILHRNLVDQVMSFTSRDNLLKLRIDQLKTIFELLTEKP